MARMSREKPFPLLKLPVYLERGKIPGREDFLEGGISAITGRKIIYNSHKFPQEAIPTSSWDKLSKLWESWVVSKRRVSGSIWH